MGQPGKFRKPFLNSRQKKSGLLHLFGGRCPALGLDLLNQPGWVVPRLFRFHADVGQDNLYQHLLIHRVGRTNVFSTAAVPIAQVTFIGGPDRGPVLALVVVPMMAHGRAAIHTVKQQAGAEGAFVGRVGGVPAGDG